MACRFRDGCPTARLSFPADAKKFARVARTAVAKKRSARLQVQTRLVRQSDTPPAPGRAPVDVALKASV